MTTPSISPSGTAEAGPSFRERLAAATPFLVLLPSVIATLVYVFLFTAWTVYISLSKSAMFPNATLQGIKTLSTSDFGFL